MKYPKVQFRGGDHGELYDNVNFARQEAEKEAAQTQKVTTLWQIRDGKASVLHEIKPKKEPVFHEIWFPDA